MRRRRMALIISCSGNTNYSFEASQLPYRSKSAYLQVGNQLDLDVRPHRKLLYSDAGAALDMVE